MVKDYAKDNRQGATEAEEILWQELRNRKINGCKFRRQHAVQGYIPDFICLEKKLVVEVDGLYHDTEEQRKLDEERTKFFGANGYREIRFTNYEVLKQLPIVLQKLKEALSLEKTTNNDSQAFSIERDTNEDNKAHSLESPTNEDNKALSFGEGLGEVSIKASIIEIGGEKNVEAGLQKAIDAKDSVGGIIECTVNGLPVGLGEPFFDSVESLLSHAVFAIPAIKGIEFGAGFNAAKMFGSEHNDSIIGESGETASNYAGGIVGGLTNSNPVVFRVVVKPTSSTPKEQESWSAESNKIEKFSVKGRHDLCIALRVPPVLEAVTAMVILDMMMVNQTATGRLQH
ncbi:MAG: chorismate synthase [Bacteroidota bacterium]|nr:chorismate synthase [Bacteroidota bacterium]